jgi:hypothetical protein
MRVGSLVVSITLLVALVVGTAPADAESVIDFEGLAEGQIVATVSYGQGISGDPVEGSVAVFGVNPIFPGQNAAMIFDATCTPTWTGNDDDLCQPALGNVLIISTDLNSADPNDSDHPGVLFQFDFSGLGSGKVHVASITVLDVEEEQGETPATVKLYSGATLLATIAIGHIGDGLYKIIPINVGGADRMVVDLQGSGAIDNIELSPEMGGEGCTPGYWKNTLWAWPPTGYTPGQDFDAVFGVDFFNPDVTLEQALNQGGGGFYRLGRHGTAALLNAAHPDVEYGLSVAEVIALVQSGDADTLEQYNEAGCPLSGKPPGAGRR